jgi:hypothetical protein
MAFSYMTQLTSPSPKTSNGIGASDSMSVQKAEGQ